MIDPLAFGSTLCVFWRKDLASAWSWGRSAGALWIRFATLYTWVQDQPQLTQVPPIPLSSVSRLVRQRICTDGQCGQVKKA